MTHADIPLTPEDIRKLPPLQRLPYVEKIRMLYPRWNAILAEIGACHKKQPYAAEPPCLLFIGPTGVGKSTLTGSYAEQFPRVVTMTGVVQPVLFATIPSPASVKNLVTVLLNALGDPRAGSGTIGGMTLRLEKLLRDCKVQILILDELQHFVDEDSRKVLLEVSNWLKRLIKDTCVACVLTGLEGEAEQVINANPQLARLFGDPILLSGFQWREDLAETIEEFRTLLDVLEGLLPLNEPSRLSDRERAWRCFVACDGIVSYLMALVRQATEDALRNGREHLDDIALAGAFTRRLAGKRRNLPNPFIGDPPSMRGPELAPVAQISQATNRRSRSRGPRPPSIQDVL